MGKPRKRTPPKRKQVKRQVPTVEDYVRKLSKERLIEIILEQLRDNEALERELLDEILERFGGASDLIEDARQLVELTTDSEPEFDHRGFAEPVDYRPVHSAFERLLKEKQYEALLQLGPTLAKGSQRHIETSSDDFEPHYSISECIGCVMQALAGEVAAVGTADVQGACCPWKAPLGLMISNPAATTGYQSASDRPSPWTGL